VSLADPAVKMTVILWHLLGTVIHQCEPTRMQEVQAGAMVFSSLSNNKRMFETIIPTKQSQHE
jgi:hypothetical protein